MSNSWSNLRVINRKNSKKGENTVNKSRKKSTMKPGDDDLKREATTLGGDFKAIADACLRLASTPEEDEQVVKAMTEAVSDFSRKALQILALNPCPGDWRLCDDGSCLPECPDDRDNRDQRIAKAKRNFSEIALGYEGLSLKSGNGEKVVQALKAVVRRFMKKALAP